MGETVCKNRHKRFEQKGDSLEEYAARHLENVPKLSVTKSHRYYKDPDRILPGAVFIYLGKRYVLSGQSSGGKQYRAYGYEQKNFPASQCQVIRCNEGLVYVD